MQNSKTSFFLQTEVGDKNFKIRVRTFVSNFKNKNATEGVYFRYCPDETVMIWNSKWANGNWILSPNVKENCEGIKKGVARVSEISVCAFLHTLSQPLHPFYSLCESINMVSFFKIIITSVCIYVCMYTKMVIIRCNGNCRLPRKKRHLLHLPSLLNLAVASRKKRSPSIHLLIK